MELAATLLAFVVGVLALVRFYSRKDNTFLFIGTGFIGAGLLDGYHAMVSAPAFGRHVLSPPQAIIPGSGFASRLFLSVLLWLSWVFWKREARRGESGRVPETAVYLIAAIWILTCFYLVAFAHLPLGYRSVPLFHRPQDLLAAFFLVLAGKGYVRKGRWKSDAFEHWLVLSITLCAGQNMFLSTSSKLFDTMYVAAHVVKLLSYGCIFVGLVVAMYHLFSAEEKIVDERTEELQKEIAERKRAQEASLLQAAALESAANAIVVTDAQGTIQWVNPAFTRLTGYSPEEAVGQNPRILKSGKQDESFYRNLWDTILAGKVWHSETINRKKDGQIYTEEMTIAPVCSATGKITNFVAIKQDVTWRKRIEQELKFRNVILSTQQEVSIDGILVVDEDKDEIISCNRRFVEMWGIPADVLATRSHDRVLAVALEKMADPHRFLQEVRALDRSRDGVYRDEAELKDGRTYERYSAPMIGDDGKYYGRVRYYRDITERKRSEQALRHSEEKYRRLVDSVPDVIWTSAHDGRITYISPNVQSILGYTAQEVCEGGKELWIGRIHPEDVQRVLDSLLSLFAENRPFDVEYQIRRKAGQWIWLHDRAIRTHEKDGVQYADGIFSDITARKRMEQKLCEYEKVVESSEQMVVVVDRSYRYVLANRSFLRSHGVEREQLLGRRLVEVLHEGVFETVVKQKLDECFQGKTVKYEMKRPFPNLGERDLALSYFPIEGPRGIDRAACVLEDITERKKAELALRESEEQFRQLAENIREVFFIFSPEPVRTVYISPAYDQIFGKPRQEVYERATAWIDSVYPEDRERAGTAFARCTQGIPAELDFRIMRPDGSIRWLHARSFPVCDSAGKFIRAVGTAEDISEQRRVLDAIRAAKDAAEAASRAKGEFLANMSHELRTPMNGIVGMTELALATDLTSEQQEYLTMVKSSADSLLGVINDILDFSKIEAGKLEFESIEFNFRSSLEATLKLLAPRAHEKGLELNCRVEPEVPEVLIGDPSRFRQIIVNLAGNAIKFTERGEVTVQVEQRPEKAGAVVLHVSVVDTGIGIPEGKQEAIFGAFTQADGSTTRRYGGTGLGLSISRQLVAMFGGRLWLESVVGQGSTFHFIARFAVGSPRQTPRSTVDLKGIPVLAVDDNSTNRRILEELLTHWQMNPCLAEDGRGALMQLQQAADAGRAFRLVIVDGEMAGMDGFTVVEQVKQDPRLATTAIMMLTSAGQRGDAVRCRELGVAAYLTKPIGQAELLDAIRQVLGTKAEKTDESPRLVTRHTLQEGKKGLHILLAEDNLVNRTVAVRLLEKHGNSVEVAGDGREVLSKLETAKFDLILMDVQMPEIDGFEATAAIRKIEQTKGGHVPIIAMTAHALKGDREHCLAVGMDGYIAKPIHVEELLKEIENVRAATVHSLEN
jgi:PAS domain S-box-containing protein